MYSLLFLLNPVNTMMMILYNLIILYQFYYSTQLGKLVSS